LAGRFRGRPGRPQGPLIAGTASTMGSSSTESWVLAADSPTARGMPRRSVSRWYLDPGLPRSVGFGPVSSPPLGAHAGRIQAGPRPVELAIAAELVQQHLMQALPHPGALPVPQPPPAGDRATAAELAGRQQPPGDTGAQLIDDAGQRGAVINAGAAAIAGRWSGQQGLDGLPEGVRNKGLDSGHGRGSWP
jgi:hypothetical protein